MVAADVISHHAGVLQVDRVHIHADGEGADRLAKHFPGDGADQGGIQAAGKQETDGRVRVQPLFHAVDQQAAQLRADLLLGFHGEISDVGRIRIADELPAHPVMPGREGQDLIAKADEVFRLAGKGPLAAGKAPVVQGPYADGVAGGDQLVFPAVIQDEREFRIQGFEHFHPVFMIEGEQNLAVGLAPDRIGLHEPLAQGTEAVELTVADHHVIAETEGLHAALVQAHDGQAVEAQVSAGIVLRAVGLETAHVRAAGDRAVETRLKQVRWEFFTGYAKDGTHRKSTS